MTEIENAVTDSELPEPEQKENAMADSTETAKEEAVKRRKSEDDEAIIDVELDYSKFQVVRGEFFAHIKEPSISFKGNKIAINAACIRRFPDTDYVQILVNSEDKKLVVRPCGEDEKDSFVWCSQGAKRGSKQVNCKVFFAKIMNLMGWNLDYRYKLLGKLVRSAGELVFSFDLTCTETYPAIYKEGEKAKMMRTPVFPQEWQEDFGVKFTEHQRQLKASTIRGYKVFSIQDNEIVEKEQSGQNEADSDPERKEELSEQNDN